MIALVEGEVQATGDGGDHLLGRLRAALAFEPRVVVGGHFAQSRAGGLTALISKMTFLHNDPEHGALPTLYAATQDVPGGSYVGPDGIASIKGYPKIGKPSRVTRDAETARQLCDVSSRLTGTGSALLSATTASPRTGRSR